MKFGFASSLKGIRPEARETAEEAARRAGLPLNEWLNTIIFQQAVEQRINSASAPHPGENSYADEYSVVKRRLDELTRRIDQVTRAGAAAYAPKRLREESDQLIGVIARLEHRLDQFAGNPHSQASTPVPGLDRAVAEITARRRALNTETLPASQYVPASVAPLPSPNLANLEDQLRRITDQIETLRRPGVEKAINALRVELGEISRTLNDAMPRRSIEIIEKQVQCLTERIAEGRHAGVDSGALAGIENGLAEVRDALRDLTPAENLVGYTDAIEALTRKVDLIVVQNDPSTMHKLERSVATLREMAAHVASNETVSSLAAQVQVLAEKIDRLAIGGGTGDAINKLELRIDALSRALTERAHSSDTLPPHLETLLQSLSDKIEQLQLSRGDNIALTHLEDRIAKLVERLDASDARFSHLEAIERGLTDLLVYIEDLRTNKESFALRAEGTSGFGELRQDFARTQDAMEAVHGTLDRLVDRLAIIEKSIRDDRQKPAEPETDILELTQPVASIEPAIRAPDIAPSLPSNTAPQIPIQPAATEPTQPASAEFSNLGLRPVGVAATDPGLPADQPLEPGSGPPTIGVYQGARIVTSEAAPGSLRSNTSTNASKSSFIAAARRAAQAAGQDPKGRPARPQSFNTGNAESKSPRTNVITRVKSLFLAASIVAIIVGSIQFASNVFNFGIFDTDDAKFATTADPDTTNTDEESADPGAATTLADDQPKPATAPPAAADTNATGSLLAPPALPGLTPAAPPPAAAPLIQNPLDPSPTAQPSLPTLMSPALNAPLLGGTPGQKADVTGSIARATTDARPAQPAAQAATADGLPAAIGSQRLRNAAQAGDAAAAYEVAMRFVEGRGVPANLEEAARWYERAASKGLAPAQFRYASMLEKGQGVKKDLVQARRLYLSAAGKGNSKAMHNLAVLYAEGIEGKPDYASAAQWFRKAAEYGVADSQYNLGVLAARGLGTEKNIAESYKWFALAAAQGDRDAGRKRDEIAAHLDPQALAAAQQAVKSFVAQTQPAEATVVREPQGGWERTTPPPHDKPRAAGSLSFNVFDPGKL